MATQKTAITPTRADNYPEWYQQVIQAADLAETSDVRGCMVIKPWGYAIWENIQAGLDKRFKATGHQNVYFPLLIPLHYLQQEANHVDGFAKECAVVTHHRLITDDQGKLIPGGELEEPYVIRPTSETIIGVHFAKWIQSYRDLPLLINQWANVMRWEMRTRLFLRTSEFLWQEGHTAHETATEALVETTKMLGVYADFAENVMAIPVIKGEKTPDERFPGAVQTYTIEAMMQDGKALQAGTSHFLGQNFARSFNITYTDRDGQITHAWTTSWGSSTRLMGALIMTHSDDDGLVLPPKIAPTQVVIIPIFKTDEEKVAVLAYCETLRQSIGEQMYDQQPIRAAIDAREINGGERTWYQIKHGVPIRLEVGPRDMNNQSVFMGRRDLSARDKSSLSQTDFIAQVPELLSSIQATLLERAKTRLNNNTRHITSKEDFIAYFEAANQDETTLGFVDCFSVHDEDIQTLIKPYQVTARCIQLDKGTEGACIFTGKMTTQRIIYAKAY